MGVFIKFEEMTQKYFDELYIIYSNEKNGAIPNVG
jgi:hypothetical protein